MRGGVRTRPWGAGEGETLLRLGGVPMLPQLGPCHGLGRTVGPGRGGFGNSAKEEVCCLSVVALHQPHQGLCPPSQGHGLGEITPLRERHPHGCKGRRWYNHPRTFELLSPEQGGSFEVGGGAKGTATKRTAKIKIADEGWRWYVTEHHRDREPRDELKLPTARCGGK